MENGFAVLMIIFAGILFLYAALLALTKDYRMLPYKASFSVQPKNPKKYTVQFAKAVALVACAIGIGGVVALRYALPGALIMIIGTILAIVAATKLCPPGKY